MANPKKDMIGYRPAAPICARLQSPRPDIEGSGRGLQLSWPFGSQHRRAIVSEGPEGNDALNVREILHTSSEDIQRHSHLTKGSLDKTEWQVLELAIPMVPAVKVEVENQDRFQYFQHTASKALAIIGHDPKALGDVLIRIALASNTSSAKAVRECLLAYSALHRHGIHAQAMESKIAGLSALKVASFTRRKEIDVLEAIQHVAAGMLLLSFEIHLSSCTSDDWTKYLCGVKKVIRAAGLDRLDKDKDLAILLDWVYYQDILARFSLRHWYRQHGMPTLNWITITCTPADTYMRMTNWIDQPMRRTSPSLELICLLSELCDAVPQPLCGLSDTEVDERKGFLEILEWKIRIFKPSPVLPDNERYSLLLELYKLAMLVYLHRVTAGRLKQTISIQLHIDRAFEILVQLGSCERQFPVFVFGCEAKSDAQRAIILDVMSRTESSVSSRSLNHSRLLLQAIWAQDDLAEGKTLYWNKVSYVISCCTTVPSFT
ncbi:hypothetical protein P171DRAFT_415436 [Karstenula rhodostoma CBS 690.94]|uniref:Fungal-specific transcription factor domain-containing protein n=1 Tax=Karstenula rhodostoma CBS 690.94 TaxID=1392251 RepID=A0A9P4PIZ6_9PLEO|nr:hypothetical protein P171DRAFT_415436 [Karstenula rhodostoma CBS 690.94]